MGNTKHGLPLGEGTAARGSEQPLNPSKVTKPVRHVDTSLEYRLVFTLVFATFLITSTVVYLVKLPFSRGASARPESPLRAASAAASASLPFVFSPR